MIQSGSDLETPKELLPLGKWITGTFLLMAFISYGAYFAQRVFHLGDELPKFKHQFKGIEIKKTFQKFWKKLPKRIWGFYIESLLIPAYRQEWGRYRKWNWRIPELRPRNPEEIAAFEEKCRLKRQQILDKRIKIAIPSSYKDHDHELCSRVTINVSGKKFQTQLRTLARFPQTLLGDPRKRIRYYDPVANEYFFDRSRSSFEVILNFYQSGGEIWRPPHVPAEILLSDINFYDLGVETIEKFKEEERFTKEEPNEMPTNLLKRKIWLLFEYPESSAQAKIVAIISIFVVIVSTTLFCIETLSIFQYYKMEKKDGALLEIPDDEKDRFVLSDPFYFVETICNIWFSFELLVRFTSCPRILHFCTSYINIIDFVAIFPYFLGLITYHFDNGQGLIKTRIEREKGLNLVVLRIIRLFRIFRIFKISRHSKGLRILAKSLRASLQELGLMIFFLFVGVILFASAVYFAELGDKKSKFTSIPKAFWWAVNTMTTVGYGDLVPVTVWGQIVGALCAISGILTISLPVPIIVSNFNNFYHWENLNEELNVGDQFNVEHCPYLPGLNEEDVTKEEPDKEGDTEGVDNIKNRKSSSIEEINEVK